MRRPPQNKEEAGLIAYGFFPYNPLSCAWKHSRGKTLSSQCGNIIGADGGHGPGGIYCKRHGTMAAEQLQRGGGAK